MPSPGVATLVERLSEAQPGVRRVAIADLARLVEADPRGAGVGALAGLVEHLPRERDERAASRLIAHLVRWAADGTLDVPTREGVRRVLWSLYESRGTPAGIAIAAIRAHDALLP
jgi:GNAT superfamily N-acetyltransferase